MVWVAAHFGEWVQGISTPSGDVVLVTLACPTKGVAVTWHDASTLQITDPSQLMPIPTAEALLDALGQPARGSITVTPDLPPGGGAGMSTAALVALARAVGAPEHLIAQACLATEGAVDPIMLDAPDSVLWASRTARVVASLPPPPDAMIVGGFWGSPQRTDPADTTFPHVDDLIAQWALGPDLRTAARIASASSERTTALRGPSHDPTAQLAVDLGALGWIRSHTGPARALIFPPETSPHPAARALQDAGFTDVISFATGGRS